MTVSQADLRGTRARMRADSRRAILVAAARVLREQGQSALTVRRVAQAVNASTKVIYTGFGGKVGLLDALYLHSFDGLARALETQLPIGDPIERLRAMSKAYRDFALAEPSLYDVMFGDLGSVYRAPLASRRQAWRSFTALRDTIAACLPGDRRDEAGRITRLLWSAMHGAVSLEQRKLLGRPDECAEVFACAVAQIVDLCRLERWTAFDSS